MSRPVQRLPGAFYLITRRCSRREFRLRPSANMTALLTVAVSLACERSQVQVIAMVAMSNHIHMVVYDPLGLVTEFMRDAHSLIGRYCNARDGVKAHFWDNAQGDFVAEELGDIDAVIRAVGYTLANPVVAGLVASPSAWPGLITRVEDIGTGRGPTAKRPKEFFREDGPVPAEVEIELHAPPGVDAERFRKRVDHELKRRVDAARRKKRAEGTPYAGVPAVMARGVFDRPETEERRPTGLAAKDRKRLGLGAPEASRYILERQLTFRREHRPARVRFALGDREVIFPAGTYEAFRLYGARRAPPHTAPAAA